MLKTLNIIQNLLSCFFTYFEQVNTSWVLKASFTDKTKAFFSFIKAKRKFWNRHTSKMGDFSLNPLKFFPENCKTYRNLAKPVSVSKVPPVRFFFLSNSLITLSITLIKFTIIFYCLEQLLKVILENNWMKIFCYISTSLATFAWVLHLLYYIQKGKIAFSPHSVIISYLLEYFRIKIT